MLRSPCCDLSKLLLQLCQAQLDIALPAACLLLLLCCRWLKQLRMWSSFPWSSHKQPTKTVLVVGGQFAGRAVEEKLHSLGYTVVLVDARAFFEYTPGILRCLVEPDVTDRLLVPHSASTVVGRVVGLSEEEGGKRGGTAVLADGRRIPFDYCVIATGSDYFAGPGLAIKPSAAGSASIGARRAELLAQAQLLKDATRVAVVGGGTVGVELAAEVVGKYGASKRVVLISSKARLLDRQHPAVSAYAERWLRKRGVEVVLGCRAAVSGRAADGTFTVTASGTCGQQSTWTTDLVFMCTGVGELDCGLWESVAARSQSSTSSDGAAAVAAARREGMPVAPSLQVLGCTCIFACGDCAQSAFEKTAFAAHVAADLVAANIQRLDRGQPLLAYPSDAFGTPQPPTITAISLYKHDGIMQFNGLVVTGWMAALQKAIIEFCQLQLARGSVLFSALIWPLMQSTVLFAHRWVIPAWSLEQQPAAISTTGALASSNRHLKQW